MTMRKIASQLGLRGILRFAEVAALVSVVYVFYVAPMRVVRGDASRRDWVLGAVGWVVWLAVAYIVAGGWPR